MRYVVLVLMYQCHPYLDIVVLLMMIGEKKHAVEIKSRTHLEMDEIEELLELARKTDERSWCILTMAFNHGLRVSECAGGGPAIPGKTRPAIPPLMLSDIDMRHRTIRVRRLKGSHSGICGASREACSVRLRLSQDIPCRPN